MWEIIDDTGQVVFIPNIMSLTDSNLVDILAWQFHVDFYDNTRDLEFRKKLVQMSIAWHRTKGTVALVEEVIDTYFPGVGTLQEWFEYRDPFPPNYPIDNTDTFVVAFSPTNVSVGADKFNINSHGLANGTQIRFVRGGLATLPTPLEEGFWYWVVGALTNSFQVAENENGAPVNLTSTGVAINQIWQRGVGGSWHDRYRFRVIISEDVDPLIAAQVMVLINLYKPVSRWPEGIIRSRVSLGTVYAAGWAHIFTTHVSVGELR